MKNLNKKKMTIYSSGMGRKKKSSFFFRWIKSDLPDREANPAPVLLLAVNKTSPNLHRNITVSPDCLTLPHSNQYDDLNFDNDRHKDLLSQLNERFRKTLSLDSARASAHNVRPNSMVNATNYSLNCSSNLPNTSKSFDKKKKRFRPKSFFSLETFLDSRRSAESSVDDFSSSKYCKFYLDSSTECSPILKGRNTPDLLDIPVITDPSHLSDCKKRLDKLENHFNKIQKIKNAQRSVVNGDPIYSEPVFESKTSQTELGLKTDVGNDVLNIPDLPKIQCSTQLSDNEIIEPINCNFGGCDERKDDSRVSRASQSSAPYWGDCSVILRDVCNKNCSNSLRKIKAKGICCKEGTPSSAYEIHITEDDQLINNKTKNLVVKTMDKSVDSIGSCSLDVDADNTDFSDTTSGSLNILTPSSTTSHYKDFTAKFHERATPGLHQNLRHSPLKEEVVYDPYSSAQPKKPSYLHLACSVNGYSNLTTYDSTLRKKLNKSREESPARLGNISSYILRNYPDDMAQKLSSTTNNSNTTYFKTSFSETSISSQNVVTYLKSNGEQTVSETKSYHVITNGSSSEPPKSFIQQRVERLYGPAALAQGFLNQKKSNGDSNGGNFKLDHTVAKNGASEADQASSDLDNSSDSYLPVLRHLRAEFRAQLPILSPKRSPLSKPNSSNNSIDLETSFSRLSGSDVVDKAVTNGSDAVVRIIPITKTDSSIKISNGDAVPKTGVYSNSGNVDKINDADLNANIDESSYENIPVIKSDEGSVGPQSVEDGHHFLALHKAEAARLEEMARLADRELEQLQGSNDVSEEVRGFLRVAAGKARLLASEKLKQFEGLCIKNINDKPDSKFHTTIEDLRGFWDMVYLQIEDINTLFEQMNEMKKSNWKEMPVSKKSAESTPKTPMNRSNLSASKKTPKASSESTPAKSALAKKRDEQRKALIEAKRRAYKSQQDSSVEIFTSSPPSDKPEHS